MASDPQPDDSDDNKSNSQDQCDNEEENDDDEENDDEEDEGNDDDSDREDEGDDEENEDDAAGEDDEKDDDDDSDEDNGLSEYERLRLERIRRNQEYLAGLGLEKAKPQQKQRSRQKKKKDKPVLEPKRSSRRVKTVQQYTEPPASVKDLLGPKKPKQPRKPKKDYNERMDRNIHVEFKRIQGHKTQTLRRTERAVKTAKRELKYWRKKAEKEERRKQREEAKMADFLPISPYQPKRLLSEVDARMEEIEEKLAAHQEKYMVRR